LELIQEQHTKMALIKDFSRRYLTPPQPPQELKPRFLHFALDIGWYGVLNGSVLAFISIYITRVGGSAVQVGLINAIPGLITLLLALPAGQLLNGRTVSKDVFTSSVLSRMFYLLLVFIPAIFKPGEQVTLIILAILLMTIPGTITNVGFTALVGEATPPAWRGYLSGIRNGLFALTNVLTLLLSGWILEKLPFPTGYQIIFAIGFLGAAMSSAHLYMLHRCLHPKPEGFSAGWKHTGQGHRPTHALTRLKQLGITLASYWKLRLDILKGPFLVTLMLMFFFHLVQFIGIPIFPVYTVNELKLSDQTISLGLAVFYATVFFGSTLVARLTEKIGNRNLFGIAICFFCLYPGLLIFSSTISVYLITHAIGGLVWALVGGAIYNYVLEKSPQTDLPAHIAWYTIAANLGMLLGSLGGPWLAAMTSLVSVLAVCAVLRALAGLAILRWG
jgi:MFS family permease